jgi:hypothetical protein
MFKRHPWLLYLLYWVAALLVGPFMLAKLFGENHLWLTLCVFLGFLGMVPLVRFISRLEVDREVELEWADRERRLGPVQESVEACWLMVEKKEPEYQRRLIKQILRTLNVAAKPEAPLPTGTKVDAYMEFGNEDWYITIKRGIDNQKRLILQGEIEDIILHAPHRDRDLWICVVVGLSDEEDANELAHFEALCKYAMQRSIVDGYHRQQDGGRRINIEVLHAIIPSTPLTEEELQELELAPA